MRDVGNEVGRGVKLRCLAVGGTGVFLRVGADSVVWEWEL